MTNPEVIVDDANQCGEGPLWDAARRRLLWDDLIAGLVFDYDPATGSRRILRRDLAVSAIALTSCGAILGAGVEGLYLFDENGRSELVVSSFRNESLCFNDMLAVPGGGVLAGTCYWNDTQLERTGCLYLISADRTVSVCAEGFEMSNGLGLSPDDRTLYFADSTTRTIWSFQFDPVHSHLSDRRILIQLSQDDGMPDGLTVDGEGFIWCALWYGAQVVRIDPEGHIERRILLPAKQPSSVAFGGDQLGELFITTAADPWASPYAPATYDPQSDYMGGALYRVRTGIQGRKEHLSELSWSG